MSRYFPLRSGDVCPVEQPPAGLLRCVPRARGSPIRPFWRDISKLDRTIHANYRVMRFLCVVASWFGHTSFIVIQPKFSNHSIISYLPFPIENLANFRKHCCTFASTSTKTPHLFFKWYYSHALEQIYIDVVKQHVMDPKMLTEVPFSSRQQQYPSVAIATIHVQNSSSRGCRCCSSSFLSAVVFGVLA